MLAKLQFYTLIGLLVLSVLTGGATVFLWKRNAYLSSELEKVTIAREKAEENLALVSLQLMNERETRQSVEAALSDLREVPDVEYNTFLPASIGNVLSDFADRMQ